MKRNFFSFFPGTVERALRVMLLASLILPFSGFSFSRSDEKTPAIYFENLEAHTRRLQVFLESNREVSEEKKIAYLLQSIGCSGAKFIRNGAEYGSGRAVSWFRYKMVLARRRHRPVLTARDFVEKIARRSEASGQPYEIILKCGMRLPVYEVMRSELEALEQAVAALPSPVPGRAA